MLTKQYRELKKEEQRKEKERLSKITFEENPLIFLNNYVKTEIKIVEVPTNILDRLNQFAYKIQDDSLYSYQITKSETKASITVKKKDGTEQIYTFKLKGDNIVEMDFSAKTD